MAVTGWLGSLRAAEKTALLQDGNRGSPRPPSALLPGPGPPQAPPGRAFRAWDGKAARVVVACLAGSALQMRKLRLPKTT